MHRTTASLAGPLTGFAFLILGGCASAPAPGEHAPAAPAAAFNGFSGAGASADAIADAASGADVLIIGETHGHPTGLAFAAEVWEQVVAAHPHAALSLEFFDRAHQAGIDDYLAGFTDEAAFKKATSRTAGNYPGGHHAMLEMAKAKKRPVYASNAPRIYTRVANKEGFERLASLTASQRQLVTVPRELPEGRYRDDFFEMMSAMPDHAAPPPKRGEQPPPPSPEAIEGMFRAQSVWDWTMAHTIAGALDSGSRPVVHVVGRFHSDFRGGLVQALEQLRPGTRVATVSVVAEDGPSLQDDDRERADFVVYAGPQPEGP